MGPTACGLVADLIDWIEGPHGDQGRPRCRSKAVVKTLETLEFATSPAGLVGCEAPGVKTNLQDMAFCHTVDPGWRLGMS
jgi:hypothetical protein